MPGIFFHSEQFFHILENSPGIKPIMLVAYDDLYSIRYFDENRMAYWKHNGRVTMLDALQKRHDFFTENGCKLSDHGIEEFYDEEYTMSQIETIFEKAMRGQQLSDFEIRQYKNCFLTEMAIMDAEADWTQQFHYGAIRDNNTAMYNQLGPDTGFDSIGEFNTAKAMSKFLNKLNMQGKLTRTILYTLNPCANEVIATMLGNFQGGCPGKIQFGSGWWFNDQLDGMTRQMNALSVLGLLSRFVGMLTDSRSFLSYPRHEYFRRLLCNILGTDVEKGLLPNYTYDVIDMSKQYNTIGINAMYETIRYFGFTKTDAFGNVFYTQEGIDFASAIMDKINEVKDSYDFDYSINGKSAVRVYDNQGAYNTLICSCRSRSCRKSCGYFV